MYSSRSRPAWSGHAIARTAYATQAMAKRTGALLLREAKRSSDAASLRMASFTRRVFDTVDSFPSHGRAPRNSGRVLGGVRGSPPDADRSRRSRAVGVKLVMTLIVRDELEILSDQLDYHLSAGVDFFVATDHRSQDG